MTADDGEKLGTSELKFNLLWTDGCVQDCLPPPPVLHSDLYQLTDYMV